MTEEKEKERGYVYGALKGALLFEWTSKELVERV